MMANIRRNVIYNCFVFQPRRNPQAASLAGGGEAAANQVRP